MHLSKPIVIQTASDIADKNGLNKLSLKLVAETLNIRTPSLYNHIESLDDLLREVAHSGMRTMNSSMTRAAVGKSGDFAIKAVSTEYFHFMTCHPGVYEAIQWAAWHGNEETKAIFSCYKELLTTLILSCSIQEQAAEEVLDLLMGVLHGYTTLQLGHALEHPQEAMEKLNQAVDTVLLGIHQKYD